MSSSTELDVRSEEILHPLTGELVPVGDLPAVAEAIEALREHRRIVNDAIAAFTAACVAESRRQGTRTLAAAGVTVEVGAGEEIEWDIDELAKLPDAGLPQERYEQLVREEVSYRVDGRVARQVAAASPAYAQVVARARRYVPKRAYVKVRAS